MKSRLAIVITLSGWLLFAGYIFYEYLEHGFLTIKTFFNPPNPYEIFLHILMLTVPIGSTIIGYLMNERKKLFVEMQSSEKMLRYAAGEWKTAFDSMPYGIMLLDKECNIIRVNKYISDLSGIPLKEMLLNKCYATIHKLDKPINNCPLMRSVKSQDTEVLEFYNHQYNKFFLLSVTPVLNEKGSAISYVHSLIDITDIKEKEKKLLDSRNAFMNMLRDITSAHKELKGLYKELIHAFANVIDAKSPWTRGHSERVADYAVAIAKDLGLRDTDIDMLKTATFLHDIGKIGTYDAILNKPAKLTADEFALVKMHTVKGEEILRPIKELEHVLPIIRSHHERFDGNGYPDGLKGNEIPLLARILSAADSYDSMTADRPYSPSPGREYAVSELKICAGTQFDPMVVEAFLRILEGKALTSFNQQGD